MKILGFTGRSSPPIKGKNKNVNPDGDGYFGDKKMEKKHGTEKEAGYRHERYSACGDAGQKFCDGADPSDLPGIWIYAD